MKYVKNKNKEEESTVLQIKMTSQKKIHSKLHSQDRT